MTILFAVGNSMWADVVFFSLLALIALVFVQTTWNSAKLHRQLQDKEDELQFLLKTEATAFPEKSTDLSQEEEVDKAFDTLRAFLGKTGAAPQVLSENQKQSAESLLMSLQTLFPAEDAPQTEELPVSPVAEDEILSPETVGNERMEEEPSAEMDSYFLSQLRKIVNEQLSNPTLNIDDIAEQMGYGRTIFYKKVRDLLQLSPNDFLKQIRMDRAAELLRQGNLNVAQVAEKVGIADSVYFSKCFKAQYKVSPSIYQKQYSS